MRRALLLEEIPKQKRRTRRISGRDSFPVVRFLRSIAAQMTSVIRFCPPVIHNTTKLRSPRLVVNQGSRRGSVMCRPLSSREHVPVRRRLSAKDGSIYSQPVKMKGYACWPKKEGGVLCEIVAKFLKTFKHPSLYCTLDISLIYIPEILFEDLVLTCGYQLLMSMEMETLELNREN